MIRKRGKMGQPVKNGTRYKKCTLVICIVDILVKVKYLLKSNCSLLFENSWLNQEFFLYSNMHVKGNGFFVNGSKLSDEGYHKCILKVLKSCIQALVRIILRIMLNGFHQYKHSRIVSFYKN